MPRERECSFLQLDEIGFARYGQRGERAAVLISAGSRRARRECRLRLRVRDLRAQRGELLASRCAGARFEAVEERVI